MTTDRPFRGIVPPVVTPLKPDASFDAPALDRVIEHLLDAGVGGLFVLGTTGEGPAVSPAIRREVVTRAVAQAAGRAPVLVGVTDSSLAAAVELGDHAKDAGAAAVVVAPPPYYPVAAPELLNYFEAVAEQMALPTVVYNIPSRTQAISLEVVRELMDVPAFVGFKDSGGDMISLHKVMADRDARRPDWSVLVGPEELLAEAVLMGADGGVAGGANLFPSLYVALHKAAAAGDLPRVRALHGVVIRLVSTLYASGRHGSSFMKSLKAAMSAAGLCGDTPAEPYQAFLPEDRERVAAAYVEARALVDAALAEGP